jgi:branched-chain amino acid transport system substrate-binding protein
MRHGRLVLMALLVAAVMSVALVGCGSSTSNVVRIGAAGPFTGSLSKIGLDSLNAIKMAVDEFNASGKLKGKKVEVVMGDDGADPGKAAAVAEKFASDANLVGVIGPMTSSGVVAALPILEKNDIALISQSGTNPSLTEQGYKVMHRVCPRDDDQAPAAASFIVNDIKAKSVYMIDDKGTYGQGLADEVEKNLKAMGVTKITRAQITSDDKDFSAILTKIKSSKPDLLYLAIPSPAQAATIIKQLVGMGIKTAIMGGDGIREKDELIKGACGAAEGVYATSIGPMIESVPEAKAFVSNFEKKYGSLSMYSGQSYEAAGVMLAAIEAAAAANNGKVDRKSVLQAVSATKDYQGVLGIPITFNAKGDLVGSAIFVVQVKGDDFVQLKAVQIAK